MQGLFRQNTSLEDFYPTDEEPDTQHPGLQGSSDTPRNVIAKDVRGAPAGSAVPFDLSEQFR